MHYLVLLAAVIYVRFSTQALGGEARQAASRWFTCVLDDSKDADSSLRFYLALLIPVGILLVLPQMLTTLHLSWLMYVFVFFVLLYAFDHREHEAQIARFMSDLSRKDVQGAYHDAEDFIDQDSRIDGWPELHQSTLAAIAYQWFQRYFPVIFWFVVVGAPAALVYGMLCQIAVDRGDNPVGKRSRLLLRVLEWVPARLLGFTYSLVGNWVTTYPAWRDSLFDFTSPVDLTLLQYTRSALQSTHQSDDADAELSELKALPGLVDRCLIIWLAIIGILVVLA